MISDESHTYAANEEGQLLLVEDNSALSLPPLTLALFQEATVDFTHKLSDMPLPDLYGATDGKAVGTKVESMFKDFLKERYDFEPGNAANGLDFPSLNLDLKVTSKRQPQSSSPFRSATQKIYGLGYHLLVIVYDKHDDHDKEAAFLTIEHAIFIDASRTGDYTLTKAIRAIVSEVEEDSACITSREAAVDDLDALLQDKNVPLDDASRRQLAEQLLDSVPEQGVLTISNALQWRLQYSRAINIAVQRKISPEVEDLNAQ